MDPRLAALLVPAALAAAAKVRSGSRLKTVPGRKVDRYANMPQKDGPGEVYRTLSRLEGEPHEWKIDLKWSCWSVDDGVWRERAPMTWRAMWEGIAEAKIGQYAETIVIETFPKKEIRSGRVELSPVDADEDKVKVTAEFSSHDDDDNESKVSGQAIVEASEAGFDAMMKFVDDLEAELIEQLKS